MIRELQNIPENKVFNIEDPLNLSYLTSEKCLSLHRTNVRLSGNQKLVHKNDSNIFIESINSSDYLNRSMFKGYKVDTNQGYLFNLKQFLSQSSKESSIYEVRKEEELVSKEFSNQYPQLYKWGAYTEVNDIIANTELPNSYRFFAPIWVYNTLPDRFLIFRVSNNELSTLEDYFNNATLVHSVSMKEDTKYGKYLRTLTNHNSFRDASIFANFGTNEITYHGINYKTGRFGYAKESNLTSFLANERTITEFNNAVTNGWMRNGLICSNLLNLEFVFSDTTSQIGFNNYIGMYVWDNEISKYEANKLEKIKNTIILSETDTETIHFKTKNNNRNELDVYNKTISIVNATQLEKVSINPIAEIQLPYPPVPGTSILIQYNELTELQIDITHDIYDSNNTTESLMKIANIINDKSTPNIIISAFVNEDTLIIKSEILDIEYENIKIILPHVFTINRPKYYNGISSDEDTFKMITDADITLSSIDFTNADIAEVDGIEYRLDKSFSYMGIPVIRLLDDYDKLPYINDSLIKIKQITNPKYYISRIVKHVDFHTTMKESPYYDVWDYSFYDYQYVFGQLLIPIFKKELDNTIEPDEIELINSYRDLFKFGYDEKLYTIDTGNIVILRNDSLQNLNNKEMLINTIDNISLIPNSTVKNEFLRLHEESLLEIRNVNILEPIVAKFVNTNGMDSYNNPISLNIDAARRYDNFQYNIDKSVRSNQDHSHQWFMLGAGPGLFDNESKEFRLYLDTINKQLGYANIPITETTKHNSITLNQVNDSYDITNTDIDVYQYLTYRLSDNDKTFYNKYGYVNMFKQDGTANYNAIYRGVEYSITGDYRDYRFAVIMINELTPSVTATITSPYTLVDNRQFKTLTLIISYKISDRYITTFNDRNSFYVDRSFLYFSNKYYASNTLADLNKLEDFTDVQLLAFDDSMGHYYNGDIVTITRKIDIERETESSSLTETLNSWYTLDNEGEPIFSLLLGIESQLIGDSFVDMIDIPSKPNEKTNFSWVVTSVQSDNSLTIMIRYTAYDIVSISPSEIWCKDIFMEFIPAYVRLYNDNETDSFIEVTMDDIVLNNSSTINVGGRIYNVPFWDKISSSSFTELPISNAKGFTKGLKLTNEFYEEIIDDKFIHPSIITNSKWVRTNSSGKKIISFNETKQIDSLSGYFLEQDQFWFISKDLIKNSSSTVNALGSKNSIVNEYSIGNLQLVLDLYPIKAIIVDSNNFIETSKKLNMLPLSTTLTLLTLNWSDETKTLNRGNNIITYAIRRQDGNYNPLFKTILQPHTFRTSSYITRVESINDIVTSDIGQLYWVSKNKQLFECIGEEKDTRQSLIELSKYNDDIIHLETFDDINNINNRYIGQMFYIKDLDLLYILYNSIHIKDIVNIDMPDREYVNCILPKNINPIWVGRHIATIDSNFDNYCEEVIDNGLRHISCHNFYKAIYDGKEYDVIADAALCEQKNYISSVYMNDRRKIFQYTAHSNTINLIDITINDLGKYFIKYVNTKYIDYSEMLLALKLYNKDLNRDNILFEKFNYELYKHHYEEFLHKHYKVTSIIEDGGKRIEFMYTNISEISIDYSKLNSKNLIITFSKL